MGGSEPGGVSGRETRSAIAHPAPRHLDMFSDALFQSNRSAACLYRLSQQYISRTLPVNLRERTLHGRDQELLRKNKINEGCAAAHKYLNYYVTYLSVHATDIKPNQLPPFPAPCFIARHRRRRRRLRENSRQLESLPPD